MSLLERVKHLCDSHEETFASLERKLGFGNATIRKWDDATPSGDRLAKVADYFNVSIDYLLGREKSPDEAELQDEDILILNRGAKKMTQEQRKKLLDMARVMFEEEFK